MGWHQLGCLRHARGRWGRDHGASADPWTSHRNGLEACSGGVWDPAPDCSDQLGCFATCIDFDWPASRPDPVHRCTIDSFFTHFLGASRCDQGPSLTFTLTLTNAFPDSDCCCGSSSSTSAGASTTGARSGSLRCSHRSRGIRGLCGRNLELQQDSQRHLLQPRRRALVDWKPGSSWTGSPLAIGQLLTSQPPEAAATPPVIDTEGGPVTLLELRALRTRVEALESERDKAALEATSLRALAEDLWIQVGRTLITKPDQWSPSPQGLELVQKAVSLSNKVVADDSDLESIQAAEHGGISGLAGKLGAWNERRKLSSERTNLELQLHPLLSQIARQSPQGALPEVDSLRSQAVAAETQAHVLDERMDSLSIAARKVSAELKLRTDAEHEMGFDAPYLAAYLKTYGPQEVQSPLILKRGERACMIAPATLARQQTRRQWVGGSQGVSFPIGLGIRYRVGSFHGHPIQQQSLGKLDAGSLVITNQRIAFIGKVKSTSIPFAKLLHIECYSDAMAVFQVGRENPDFYLTAQPKYALFLINWFLNQAT
jgi:hypothetical protein